MELIIIVVIGIIIVGIFIAANISSHGSLNSCFEEPQREIGRRGEEKAAAVISYILRKDDSLFTNVKFTYGNRPAELDCVIVNKYGVFIIEVKNYIGYIVGDEEDYEWKKFKKTDAGNIYEKDVKNPVKQVKRQVYLLAKYLDFYGVDVWVKGYALLLHGNSPIRSEYILSDVKDIDKSIHTSDRALLPCDTVKKIRNILSH